MKTIITHLRKTLNQELLNIPPCNQQTFKIECQDFLMVVRNNPHDWQFFANQFWLRITHDFKRRDLSIIPPKLIRYANETNEQYLNRIYNASPHNLFNLEKIENG